jgi:hypothetical protein
VVDISQPGIEGLIEIGKTLSAHTGEKVGAHGAKKALDLAFAKSHQMQVVWVAPPVDSASSIRFIRCVAPNTNW